MTEEYTEEEEYLTNENDPQKVLIVPEDDYVTTDNEEKIEHEEILASPQINILHLSKHDFEREEAVLHSLRNGEFRK